MLPKPFYCERRQNHFDRIRKEKRKYTPGKGSAKAHRPGIAGVDNQKPSGAKTVAEQQPTGECDQ